MKNIYIYVSFILFSGFFFASSAFADMAPSEEFHVVNRCVKVVNLNDFSNIVLIGRSLTLDIYEHELRQSEIKNDKCIYDHYYGPPDMAIYWNIKDKPTVIDTKNLLASPIEAGDYSVYKDYGFIKEIIEYKIASTSDDKFVLYKSKRTKEYNNGTPAKVETFLSPSEKTQSIYQNQPEKEKAIKSTPLSVSPQDQVKKGFWRSFFCFIKRLLGGQC